MEKIGGVGPTCHGEAPSWMEPAVREQAREVLRQMNGLQSGRSAMGKKAHSSVKVFQDLH